MRFQTEDRRRRRSQLPSAGESVFGIYHRALGLVALALGIAAMARIVGIGSFEPARFDLMPEHWRIASASLAILYAAAGFGLWQKTRWGIVTGVGAVGLHISMHTIAAGLFGRNDEMIMFLVTLIATYAGFWLLHLAAQRRRALAKH
jgi:hypothetical protein